MGDCRKTMKIASPLTLKHFAQAIKVGVAGIVALFLARLFRLPQAYWAGISAFVVMGVDVNQTIAASRDRLIGTAVGACLGAFFFMLWGSQLWAFGIAVTVTVLFCAAAGLDRSYRLACVTVAIVMLIKSAASPWKTALSRFLEVALGIVVALAVAALPPKASPQTSAPSK
jgi:uncharacterized membrane protein YgaE (UPF0421/DUF939 family)